MGTRYDENFTVKDFEAGDNVETHPATDAWMSGDRFGMVTKIGRKYIHVKMDRSEKILQFLPKNLGQIVRAFVDEFEPIEESIEQIWEEQDRTKEDFQTDPSKVVFGEFNFGYNEHLPLPVVPCDNSIEEVLPRPTPAPAQVFTVQGARVSTRSSKPWKRRLAKKILRETGK